MTDDTQKIAAMLDGTVEAYAAEIDAMAPAEAVDGQDETEDEPLGLAEFQPYRTALTRRVTHKYVGSYQHEDQWETMGTVTVQMRSRRMADPEDPCEPTETMMMVEVDLDGAHAEAGVDAPGIVRALRDTFTKAGCHHEHDCCGCWSTYVTEVLPCVRSDKDRYVVTTWATRNY